MSETIDLFKVPLYVANIDIDNKKFLKELETIKIENRVVSNIGGFQSKDLPLKHKSLKQFKKILLEESNKLANSIDLKPINQIKNIWLNINYFKDYNIVHDHPGCVLSGVYYLKTPKDCGTIQFCNPVEHIQYYWEPHAKNYNNYTSPEWWMPVEEGKLYIFPHYLKHYVKPNMNKDEFRVSLSFNLS